MDKYMASYMLYEQNDPNFKVFKDYEEKIPYELICQQCFMKIMQSNRFKTKWFCNIAQ